MKLNLSKHAPIYVHTYKHTHASTHTHLHTCTHIYKSCTLFALVHVLKYVHVCMGSHCATSKCACMVYNLWALDSSHVESTTVQMSVGLASHLVPCICSDSQKTINVKNPKKDKNMFPSHVGHVQDLL